MPRSLTISAVLILSCLMNSGCGDVTLGPRVETRFVIVRAGHPVEILENKTVKGRRITDDSIGRVDVGGWIAMPREHYEAMDAALKKATEKAR